MPPVYLSPFLFFLYRWLWLALVTWLSLVLSVVSTHFSESPRLRACSKTPEISALWNHWNLKQGTSHGLFITFYLSQICFRELTTESSSWQDRIVVGDLPFSMIPSNKNVDLKCHKMSMLRLTGLKYIINNIYIMIIWLSVCSHTHTQDLPFAPLHHLQMCLWLLHPFNHLHLQNRSKPRKSQKEKHQRLLAQGGYSRPRVFFSRSSSSYWAQLDSLALITIAQAWKSCPTQTICLSCTMPCLCLSLLVSACVCLCLLLCSHGKHQPYPFHHVHRPSY